MKWFAGILGAAALLLVPSVATANNKLILLNNDQFLNKVYVAVEGGSNALEILQEHTGGAGANTLAAAITGDFNGGPLGSSFTGAAKSIGMRPGTLTQSGFNNSMNLTVNGSHNLFAFAQIGSGNVLHGSVTGHSNQAAVLQSGNNNHAVFSQNGTGNLVSITQRSW